MNDDNVMLALDAALSGDQIAWKLLIDNLSYQVRLWAIRAGAELSDINDISQVAWLKLWLALNRGRRFTSGAEMLGYLQKCTRSEAIEVWRRAQRQPKCSDEEAQERGYTPVTHLFDGIADSDLRLLAYLWYGYSVKETATLMGMKASTVYKRRSRLCQDLQRAEPG